MCHLQNISEAYVFVLVHHYCLSDTLADIRFPCSTVALYFIFLKVKRQMEKVVDGTFLCTYSPHADGAPDWKGLPMYEEWEYMKRTRPA